MPSIPIIALTASALLLSPSAASAQEWPSRPVTMASDLLSNFIQLAKEKRVRLLALATPQRLSDLPEVPTVQELIPAPFEAAAWFVIMVRAGTPADTLQKINAVTNRYLQSARGQAGG
jgi:tripartite-type tricarboxylate transporter receptor subunit TctC